MDNYSKGVSHTVSAGQVAIPRHSSTEPPGPPEGVGLWTAISFAQDSSEVDS